MKTIIILNLLLLGLPSMSHATSIEKPATVMVTLPPLAGLVLSLAPQTHVQCLLPNNADPHHFQLKPRQVDSLRKAILLIRSPRDDKHWPGLSSQAPALTLWKENHEHEHEHHEPNHAWLNPQEVSDILPTLTNQLQQSLALDASLMNKQLQLTQAQVKRMWQQWQTMVEATQLKQRGVMMQHPSWQGLFEALGVPIRGVLESAQHGQEYGPRKLEKALATLKEHPETILIGDSNHSNRALVWLKKQSGHAIIPLDALGQCGEPWLDLMQRNLKTLQTLSGNQP